MKLTNPHFSFFILVFVFINLSSCRIYKRKILDQYCLPSAVVHDTVKITKTDSIYKKLYDSIVSHPAVIHQIQISNPCDSIGNLKPIDQMQISGHDTIRVYSKGDIIYVKANCEGQIERYKTDLEYSNHRNDSLVQHISDITKIKKEDFNWWQKFKLSWAGDIIICLFIFIAALKFSIHLLNFINKHGKH